MTVTVLICNTTGGNSISLYLSLSLSLSLSHCTLSLKRPPRRENNKAGQSVWYFQRILHITQRAERQFIANLMRVKLNSTYKSCRDMKCSTREVFPAVVPDGVTWWHHATRWITCRASPGEIMSFSHWSAPEKQYKQQITQQNHKAERERRCCCWTEDVEKEQEALRITRRRLNAERSGDCFMGRCR